MTIHEDDIIPFNQLYLEMSLKALNKARTTRGAADLLGISRRTLTRWKVQYGITCCPVTRKYYLKEELYVDNPLRQSPQSQNP